MNINNLNEKGLIFWNILNSKTPHTNLLELDDVDLLKNVLPELSALKGVDRYDGRGHKDNFIHTIGVVANASKISTNPWFICVAIMHDLGKGPTKKFENVIGWTFHLHEEVGANMVEYIFDKFNFSTDKIEYVKKMILYHGHVKNLCKPIVTDTAIRRFMLDIGDELDDLLLFCKCDMTTANEGKIEFNMRTIDELKNKIENLKIAEKTRLYELPVTGEDIMKYFNLKPGKEVGLIKRQLRYEVLNGALSDNYNTIYNRMKIIGTDIIKS